MAYSETNSTTPARGPERGSVRRQVTHLKQLGSRPQGGASETFLSKLQVNVDQHPTQLTFGRGRAINPRKRFGMALYGWAISVVGLALPLVLAASAARADAKPSRTGFADVTGGRIFYQVYGDLASDDTPLLILHGTFMSSDGMIPLFEPFVGSRPVIAIDQRGHGRTGDLPGPVTSEMLADDAAGVLDALEVSSADVLGYSMGGTVALFMAIRYPELVAKQIIVSGPSRRDGWYPKVLESMTQMTPEMFAGSPLEAEYGRLSPTPDGFPTLVEKMRNLDGTDYDGANAAVRSIDDKTMIIVGDADGVALEHAVELFKLRGGGDMAAATQGFLKEAPPARLAIIPATSHLGMVAQAELIALIAIPFLDDTKPVNPSGFLE